MACVPPPLADDTFEWVVPPAGGAQTFCGVVYPDGSGIDPKEPVFTKLGWSFVVVGVDGAVIAAARGTVPCWITDVPGTEAWALMQALMRAEPGCTYKVDCFQVVDGIKRGKKWATAAQRPLARIFGIIFAHADDVDPEAFIWMPAHTRQVDVGRRHLSDSSTLTSLD